MSLAAAEPEPQDDGARASDADGSSSQLAALGKEPPDSPPTLATADELQNGQLASDGGSKGQAVQGASLVPSEMAAPAAAAVGRALGGREQGELQCGPAGARPAAQQGAAMTGLASEAADDEEAVSASLPAAQLGQAGTVVSAAAPVAVEVRDAPGVLLYALTAGEGGEETNNSQTGRGRG